VRSYLQLTQQARRFDRISRQASATIGEMRRHSLALHLEWNLGHERWHLSDGQRVETDVAQAMITSGDLIADGDSLFSQALNQTYRVRNARNY
jgi:hypothetical protein